MKNIKKYSVVLLLFFVISAFNYTYSQTAGYLGKRFSIGVDTRMSYALVNPNANGKSLFPLGEESFSPISFNFVPSIMLQYIAKDDLMLGVQLFQYKTKHNLSKEIYIPSITGYMADIEAKGLIFVFKFFEGNLAPLGKYDKLNLGFTATSTQIFDSPYPPSLLAKNGFPSEFYYFMFGFGKGRTHLLFDRLLIDHSIDFGVNFPLNDFMNFIKSDFSSSKTEAQYNHRKQHGRLLGLNSLMLSVSFSFLP